MTDQEFESCMILMTQGDREGLRLVYEEYIGYIYAIVLDVLKNKENAHGFLFEALAYSGYL